MYEVVDHSYQRQRYEHSSKNPMNGNKLDTKIYVPETIDMTPFTTGHSEQLDR